MKRLLAWPCATLVALSSTMALTVVRAEPAAAGSTTQTIDVSLTGGFSPKQIDLATGTTIVWHNTEQTDYPVLNGKHNVVADDGSFKSPDIIPGARWSMEFLKPGTYTYKCSIHPQLLQGTLVVSGPVITPAPTAKSVSIVEDADTTKWGFKPADLIAVTGTTVTWTNDGAQTHTVTADDNTFDSGKIDPGKSFAFTFHKPVSLRYVCSLHTWMKGTLRISASGTAPPPPPPAPPTKHTTVTVPTSAPRKGNAPVTMTVLAVERDASNPNTWRFAPSTLRARVGDTVIWRNIGASPHTITADDRSFDSGAVAPGSSFTRRLREVGTFSYVCTFHPWMKGSVVVAAAGTAIRPVVHGDIASPTLSEATPVAPSAGVPAAGAATVVDPHAVARKRLVYGVLGGALFLGLAIATATFGFGFRSRRRPPSPPGDADQDGVVDLTQTHEPLHL